MAQTEDFLNDDRDNLNTSSGRNSTEIRSEIDHTRAEMDETFAALDAKLTPSQIGLELWHLFKGGSSAGAGKLWRIAREHPMPSTVIGLGFGWLLVQSSKKKDGRNADQGTYRAGYAGNFGSGRSSNAVPGYDDKYDPAEGEGRLSAARDKVQDILGSAREKVSDAVGTAREKVGEATDWTQEHALDLGHKAKSQAEALTGKTKSLARRTRTGLWETLEENPLMVGAATLAVGVVAGLLIPETEKEDELMGEARDHLVQEAKEAGQQTWEKGKHVAEAVADKVKDEVKNEVKNAGLTPEGMVEKVKNVAQEAANTAKEEAKNQNFMPGSVAQEQQPAMAQR
jgi:gas vesicle protein